MIDLATKTAIADAKGIAEAARILKDGGLVAFPDVIRKRRAER